MATISDIIARAFTSVEIGRVGDSMGGSDTIYALGVLNEMLDKWTSDGIAHGLSDVVLATDVYNGALVSAIRKNLALELADGPYRGKVTPKLVREALDEKNNLMPYEGEVDYDQALRIRRGFDIENR